jgi:hypothetical protein
MTERTSAERRTTLVEEIGRRVPQPIDVLEIAAVIESMGVTDPVAAEDYGVASSFELAEQIFPHLLARAAARVHAGHEPDDPNLEERESEPALVDVSARGLLALAPLVLLFAALQALAAAGWTTGSVLALCLGVTAAMLLTSGPILAIGRRTAVYLGFGYGASARRFVITSSAATLLGCWLLAGTLLGAASAADVVSPDQRLIFVGSLAAYALLWLLSAGLLLAGASFLVVAVYVVGLALGLAAGLQAGTLAGLAVGYGVIVAALAAGWGYFYPRDGVPALRLPSVGAAVLEALPYVAFGSAFAILLLEPHLLGWFGDSSANRIQRLTILELSLLLALPPVLLATGVNERIMRRFWEFAKERQRGDGAEAFRRGVLDFHRHGLTLYVLTLGGLSLATVVGVELIVYAGGLESVSQLVFVCGVAGFFLLGLGQFSCLFMLSLALPGRALRPVVLGLVVLSTVGIPLSLIDFRLSALAFALAAAAFAAAAGVSCVRVLGEAPHRYATAF